MMSLRHKHRHIHLRIELASHLHDGILRAKNPAVVIRFGTQTVSADTCEPFVLQLDSSNDREIHVQIQEYDEHGHTIVLGEGSMKMPRRPYSGKLEPKLLRLGQSGTSPTICVAIYGTICNSAHAASPMTDGISDDELSHSDLSESQNSSQLNPDWRIRESGIIHKHCNIEAKEEVRPQDPEEARSFYYELNSLRPKKPSIIERVVREVANLKSTLRSNKIEIP